MKRIIFNLTLITGALCLISCGPQVNKTETERPESSSDSTEIADIENDFSFRLFQSLLDTKKQEENFLVSPFSVYTDLGMLVNGASGETRRLMKQTMGLKNHTLGWFNQAQSENGELILRAKDTTTTLALANAIYYDQDLYPKSSFLKTAKTSYQAAIKSADFKDKKTPDRINQWVKINTHGKIESIIDQIARGESMFLLNALYFKSRWEEPFDPKSTKEDVFKSSNGTRSKLPFMGSNKRYNYLKTESLQMVELPYNDWNFSMFVILPTKNKTPTSLMKTLDYEEFSKLSAQMKSQQLKLKLPKWKGETTFSNLKKQLSAMGMGQAFKNHADFSKLFKQGSSKISEVKHKTYVSVDETGTEAAAATSTGMVATSLPVVQAEMTVDRPFLYLIRENRTGTLLFLGKVDNPQE